MELIPSEIKAIKQWSYSFSLEEIKRPTHYSYAHDGALSFDEAVEMAGEHKLIGFYVTKHDPYLLVDIDDVDNPEAPYEELPVALANLIVSNNTYSEVSPSGRGIRLILQLPSAETKDEVDGMVFYISADYEKKKCQVNFGQPWQTITGNATPYATDEVAVVSLQQLGEVFNIRLKGVVQTTPSDEEIDVTKLPSLGELSSALMSIPLDQNPRLQRAYEKTFNDGYEHYTFWLKMMMGVHHYSVLVNKPVECLEMINNWSMKDELAYEGDEAIHKHWRSLSNTKESDIVSYKTVFGVAYNNRLFWPVPRKQSKEEREHNKPLKPMNTEYVNFTAMVDYYNIKLFRDESNPDVIYMTGDNDIVQQHFVMHRVDALYDVYYGPYVRDTLIPAFHMFSQSMGFTGISHSQITMFVKNILAQTRKTVNFIKMYFDTPYEKLPDTYRIAPKYHESTTYEKLFDCIDIDYMTDNHEAEHELYKAYYKKWLMGLIRNLYHKEMKQTNNCVLLLTGREQIRKTSHFRYLLPEFMKDMIAFTTHSFANESGMRDVVKLSSTNLIIVWDELEQFLVTGAESNFKKIIDGNPQKIIDKYEVVEKTVLPIAVYGATSNLREFRIGNEGSRRLFHLPVRWIDTDGMQKICWHKLINQLRREAKWGLKTGVIPWLLTEEQLSYQTNLHTMIRSKNTADFVLEEIFDFSDALGLKDNGVIIGIKSLQTDTSNRLLTVSDVYTIMEKTGFNATHIKRPTLVKSLERLCGLYTNTTNRRVSLSRPRCEVYRGLAIQHQYKKFILPPMRQEIADNLFKQFKGVVQTTP